jgi:hypothetical protein
MSFTVTIHGEAMNGRAVGRPRTLAAAGLSSRDPVVAARLARSIAMKGEWRTLPHRDDQQKILAAIAAEARWAVLALPAEATELLPALGKDLRAGCCHWGAAAMQRSPEPEPPRTEVLLALLGNPCSGCQQRWSKAEATAAAAQREREHVAELTAAGFKPAAFGRLRTDEEVAAYKRSLESLTDAKLPPRPTGAIWPAGQEPPGLTAAARSAARMVPPPSYYRPGRPR